MSAETVVLEHVEAACRALHPAGIGPEPWRAAAIGAIACFAVLLVVALVVFFLREKRREAFEDAFPFRCWRCHGRGRVVGLEDASRVSVGDLSPDDGPAHGGSAGENDNG